MNWGKLITSLQQSTSATESMLTTTTVDLPLVDLSANIVSIQVPPMNMSNWTSTTTELSTTTSVTQEFQPIGQSTERLSSAQLRSRITSVDRISQEDVKVRFFVLSHERYVEGSKAKETFSEISNNELSAIMSLPVTEPVTTLMEEKSVETKTSGFTIPLVVLGVLLILFIIIGVVCYKKQRNYFAKVKESSSEFSERNSPAPIITPDKSRVSSVASRYPIVKAYEGDDHTDRSRAKSESRSFPPVDRKKKLISEMSEAGLIDDDAYEELFSYVKPPPPPKKSGLTRVHLRDEENLSLGANVPIYFPPTGGFEGSQIVRISPTQRRRQAREILDAAFPSPTAEVRRIFHSYADVI